MKKPTVKMLRRAERNERFYRILREYQEGVYTPQYQSGVVVGRLDIALSKVYDKLVEAADEISQ